MTCGKQERSIRAMGTSGQRGTASLLADEYDAKSSKPVPHRSSVPMPARRSPTAPMAGEFKWIHNLAIDGEGNLYTSEVDFGRRVQRFVLGGAGF